MRLFSLLAASLGLAEFIPTTEWQKVEDGDNIPGGLDVRLDIETGERFARLPESDNAQDTKEPKEPSNQIASLSPSDSGIIDKLEVFEELAHDIDRGEEIMRDHFIALEALSQGSTAQADQAAKIIQVALRHNSQAARAVLKQNPNYPSRLVQDLSTLTWRRLGIYGSLISTQLGADSCSLQTSYLGAHLSEINWNNKILKRFETIVEDMHDMGKDLHGWAVPLETDIRQHNSEHALYLLKLYAKVVELGGSKPSHEFLEWLSNLVSNRGGGDSTLIEYAKTVRHTIFGNKNADRLHQDL